MTDHDAELSVRDADEMRTTSGPEGKIIVWGLTDGRMTVSPKENETMETLVDEARERIDMADYDHRDVVARVWMSDDGSHERVEWSDN